MIIWSYCFDWRAYLFTWDIKDFIQYIPRRDYCIITFLLISCILENYTEVTKLIDLGQGILPHDVRHTKNCFFQMFLLQIVLFRTPLSWQGKNTAEKTQLLIYLKRF